MRAGSLLRCALATLALASPAAAQHDDAPLAFATGGFFALSVPDLGAAVAWYERHLGLARGMTLPRSGTLAGLVILEGHGVVVELMQLDEARPRSTEQAELVHGIAKAGIVVSNFDSTVARLRARGVTFAIGPYPARADMRANVAFRDPAGNLIQILGPYARP
jgi:methylmalonyl-CoA/ethylmalonyl-CoA epimerase